MRVKSIVYSSALVMGLLLSGCGSSESEGELRLSTQQMLDKGDFEGVIDTLGEENLTTDQNILLGMAYLGKSGATLTNIITLLDESSNESGDEFSTFVTKLKEKAGDTALPDLTKSKAFFLEALGDIDCDNEDNSLTTSQKDICTFAGLSDTTKSALTVSYLVEELDTFTTDESDDKLTASTCAMAYAFNEEKDTKCTGFLEGSTVTFTQSQKTYRELNVSVDGTPYRFLLTPEENGSRATAVTDDFCSNNDFSTRQKASQDGFYPCPVVTTPDETEITAMDTLVDTLNNGLDSIQAEEGSDLAEQIDDIKEEIAENGEITEQDIIDYLNDQNNNEN